MHTRLIRICSIACCVFFAWQVQAQDPHFSQFYLSPQTLNPAITGSSDYRMRVAANYRNQWSSVTVPYQTFSAAADGNINFKTGSFGLGAIAMNDMAGDGNLRSTSFGASVAYHQLLGESTVLSAGAQLGGVQRSLDFTKLFFESQFDGDILNGGIGSGETFTGQNFFYLDVSAGVNLFHEFREGGKVYLGAALYHINSPKISYMNDNREVLYRKLVLHGGAEFNIGDRAAIIPQAIFMKQGPSTEINVGALLKYKLGAQRSYKDDNNNAIYIGTLHRFNDAQIVQFRLDLGPMIIGLSYDFNVSSLVNASRSFGGPEVALMYNIGQPLKRGSVICPRF